jgi:hypothetical protein
LLSFELGEYRSSAVLRNSLLVYMFSFGSAVLWNSPSLPELSEICEDCPITLATKGFVSTGILGEIGLVNLKSSLVRIGATPDFV